MSSFFSSLADKAQHALKDTPLSGQIEQLQSKFGGTTAGDHRQNANEQQGNAASKPPSTLGNLTHQLRNLQMQYSTVSPVQRIITSEKGVVIDFGKLSNDAKSQSKELYMWGQHEHEDLKDVTDRLAYLNFVHGSLSAAAGQKLDSARSSLKLLRDSENNLAPRRQQRGNIATQISRIEHEKPKGLENRLADLKAQQKKLEADDEMSEREIEILKRKTLKDSETWKWAALREYGEKLVLLAQASESIIAALPTEPPIPGSYKGAQATAATRASLQYALDHFKPGTLSHSFQPSEADLNRSDSRSFGVTHANELSSIASTGSRPNSRPVTPTQRPEATHESSNVATIPASPTMPVNPSSLNNAPSHIPSSPKRGGSAGVGVLNLQTEDASTSAEPMPSLEGPTVAETGVPVTAGAGGPGPASGSLHDLKASRSNSQPSTTPPSAFGAPAQGIGKAPLPGSSPISANPLTAHPAQAPPSSYHAPVGDAVNTPPGYGSAMAQAPGKLDSAEEEKARLQREERERLLRADPPAPSAPGQAIPTTGQKYESAEEEKKRLEREERERLLNEGSSVNKKPDDNAGPGGNPPAYQDF